MVFVANVGWGERCCDRRDARFIVSRQTLLYPSVSLLGSGPSRRGRCGQILGSQAIHPDHLGVEAEPCFGDLQSRVLADQGPECRCPPFTYEEGPLGLHSSLGRQLAGGEF